MYDFTLSWDDILFISKIVLCLSYIVMLRNLVLLTLWDRNEKKLLGGLGFTTHTFVAPIAWWHTFLLCAQTSNTNRRRLAQLSQIVTHAFRSESFSSLRQLLLGVTPTKSAMTKESTVIKTLIAISEDIRTTWTFSWCEVKDNKQNERIIRTL